MKKFKITWTQINETILEANNISDVLNLFKILENDGALRNIEVKTFSPLAEEILISDDEK